MPTLEELAVSGFGYDPGKPQIRKRRKRADVTAMRRRRAQVQWNALARCLRAAGMKREAAIVHKTSRMRKLPFLFDYVIPANQPATNPYGDASSSDRLAGA